MFLGCDFQMTDHFLAMQFPYTFYFPSERSISSCYTYSEKNSNAISIHKREFFFFFLTRQGRGIMEKLIICDSLFPKGKVFLSFSRFSYPWIDFPRIIHFWEWRNNILQVFHRSVHWLFSSLPLATELLLIWYKYITSFP